MTDKELLEAAAKAIGKIGFYDDHWEGFKSPVLDGELADEGVDASAAYTFWNPLTSDDDALRLAVTLKLNIGFGSERLQGSHWDHVEAFAEPDEDGRSFCPSEEMGNDPYAAVRRAIVRAAAAMSKQDHA
jgi:hypothetical protein